MKTHELTNVQLDWAVAQCEAVKIVHSRENGWWETSDPCYAEPNDPHVWSPSTNWSQGGPLIEREKIEVFHERNEWGALINGNFEFNCCVTPLFAAMSCYVASKLGYDIWIPEALKR